MPRRPRPRPQPRVRGRGLTLVELLVCVAIIALLLAMLLPALSRARGAAGALRCMSRQRQLAVATMTHQHDFAGRYPRPLKGDPDRLPPHLADRLSIEERNAAVWFNALDVYLDPHAGDAAAGAIHKQDPVADRQGDAWREANRTIKMNAYFCYDDAGIFYYFDRDVRRPGDTVVFADGRASDVHANDPVHARRYDLTEGLVAPRHGGHAANVGFADGHGQQIQQALNPALAAPGWFRESTGKQDLIWNFAQRDEPAL
ncbi:MAG: prepilin-type N-terminal cleavage/methylation domain-containing protein [Phycisphaeraceae bacterium]